MGGMYSHDISIMLFEIVFLVFKFQKRIFNYLSHRNKLFVGKS